MVDLVQSARIRWLIWVNVGRICDMTNLYIEGIRFELGLDRNRFVLTRHAEVLMMGNEMF